MLWFYLTSELSSDVVENSFSSSGTWYRWVELCVSLGTLSTAAINFFIYVIWGRNYREEMLALLKSVSIARGGRSLIHAIQLSIRSLYASAAPPPDAAAAADKDRERDPNNRHSNNRNRERSADNPGTSLNGCESCALRELAH